MNSSRPTHINLYSSAEDFFNGKLQQLPIDEAERKLSNHRKIETFTWNENFDNEKAVQKYADKMVSPDKLALCYFGDDIGYGVVSVAPIKEGEVLVFAGDVIPKESYTDYNNPYVSEITIDSKDYYIDSKKTGGFSSMMLDLPNHVVAIALLEKINQTEVDLAVANFTSSTQNLTQDLAVTILTANRDIKPNELIGASYGQFTRLMYPEFIGFCKDGTRLCSGLNTQLNRIIYNSIKYRDILDEHKDLYKAIKFLQAGNIPKAVSHIQKTPYLSELKTSELNQIFTYFNDKTPTDESLELRSKINEELHHRIDSEPQFKERKLMELVIESNRKQIQAKGKSELYLYDNFNYYVVYPDIIRDFCEIGKQHEARGSLSVASSYYQCSLFYAHHYSDVDKECIEEVEANFKRMTIAGNAS